MLRMAPYLKLPKYPAKRMPDVASEGLSSKPAWLVNIFALRSLIFKQYCHIFLLLTLLLCFNSNLIHTDYHHFIFIPGKTSHAYIFVPVKWLHRSGSRKKEGNAMHRIRLFLIVVTYLGRL